MPVCKPQYQAHLQFYGHYEENMARVDNKNLAHIVFLVAQKARTLRATT